MSPISKNDLLNVAVEACLASSDIIMESLGLAKISKKKGKTNLVTETDLKSEKIIKELIQSNFKNHQIMAEESDDIYKSDSKYLWIIDPLDGTTNFVHGYPSFSVSIALYKDNGPYIAAVLEMPNLKLYTAQKNKGAFCEGRQILSSATTKLEDTLLVTGFGYEHGNNWNKNMKLFKHFTDITQGVRRLGAASIDICHVASGLVDGFWEYDLKPWDTAAGILIAQEAGCLISDINGNPYDLNSQSIVITNKHIKNEFLQEVKDQLN